MIETLIELAPHLRERLAEALDVGMLPAPCSATAVRAVVGDGDRPEGVAEALAELAALGVAGRGAASWLRMLDRMAGRRQSPDLVWSGPGVPGLNARKSSAVYAELLGSAERSLWVSTYAFFDGPKAFKVMADRMQAWPDLKVVLLLNIQRKPRDSSASDQVVRRFADHFWDRDWPGTIRPDVFYDPRSLEEGGPAGVLHAKAVVADGEAVFVTSANFTEAALERNV